MIVVDTTVWIDYFNGRSTAQTNWLDRHADLEDIALLDLNLCEVLQGFRDEKQFMATQSRLLEFTVLPTGGTILAIAAARNYRTLRRQGITIRVTIDCLIATACMAGGHQLLHNDRDFEAFERHLGLSVLHP